MHICTRLLTTQEETTGALCILILTNLKTRLNADATNATQQEAIDGNNTNITVNSQHQV
jgi:hypothetical protein